MGILDGNARKQQAKRIFKEVAFELTGYGEQEADAWAQGMADALIMVNRLPPDEHSMRDFACHAARA